MASKFVILQSYKNAEHPAVQKRCFWKLLDANGDCIISSGGFVNEAEARSNISAVKRSINKFTKVEVRND